MKPVIIYQEANENDKIILSKEEFERLIAEVYEQGKQDGTKYYTNPIIYPTTPSYPTYPVITWSTNTAEVKYPDYTMMG